jgi:hypothetical protein
MEDTEPIVTNTVIAFNTGGIFRNRSGLLCDTNEEEHNVRLDYSGIRCMSFGRSVERLCGLYDSVLTTSEHRSVQTAAVLSFWEKICQDKVL